MEENNQTLEERTEETDETEIESEEKEGLGEEGEAEETSQEPEPPTEIDYKRKFAESTRESQILLAKIKKLEEKLGRVTRDEIPAEQELKSLYPDWEVMGELERKLVEKNLILERRLGKVEQEFSQMKEEADWERELSNFLEKANILERYPELEGREKEFKEFAKKPTHKGVPLNVLTEAFLFQEKKEILPTKKGSVLERGTGGPKVAPPKKGMTTEELKILRETDYKKYKELITKHPDWIPTEIEE